MALDATVSPAEWMVQRSQIVTEQEGPRCRQDQSTAEESPPRGEGIHPIACSCEACIRAAFACGCPACVQWVTLMTEAYARRGADAAYLEAYHGLCADVKSRIARINAHARSRALFLSLLPKTQRDELNAHEHVTLDPGNGHRYRIRRAGQTICYNQKGAMGQACLQLTINAPVYDRMIAEYLLIKNDESRYWQTANLISLIGDEVDRIFDAVERRWLPGPERRAGDVIRVRQPGTIERQYRERRLPPRLAW